MDWMDFIGPVIGLISGGGLATLATLKATRNIANSQALTAHDKVWTERLDQLREEIDYERALNLELLERNKQLIERNTDKENRFQEQTLVVRKHVAEVIELTKRVGELELELAHKRCETVECPWRMPPNVHTPPRPDIDKDTWHKNRININKNEDTD